MTQRYAHLVHQTLLDAAEVVPAAIGSAIFVARTKRETASEFAQNRDDLLLREPASLQAGTSSTRRRESVAFATRRSVFVLGADLPRSQRATID